MKIKLVTSVATILLAQTTLLSNDSTKLEDIQVVTSASGYEQKITDAPASISVITQEDLTKKPYVNLLDAVRDIEGVDIGETNDKTNNGTISIRGMGSDYTLILIDGKKQNTNGDIYPNSFLGAQLASIPPLSMIERVEVIRGPMSTLYGSDAIGGVVNIITKKISNEWSGAIGYNKTFQSDSAYGNNDKTDITIMGPLIKDKLGLSLRGSFYEQEKSNPLYKKAYLNGVDVSKSNDTFGSGKGNVQNENWNFGTGLSFTPNDNHTIKVDYDISKQKFDNKPYIKTDGTIGNPLGTGDNYKDLWYYNKTTKQYSPRAGYSSDNLQMQREQYSLFWEADWNIGKTTLGVYQVNSENIGRTMPLSSSDREFMNSLYNKYKTGSGASGKAYTRFLAEASETEKNKFNALLPRDARILDSSNTTYSAKYELGLNKHYIVLGSEYLEAQMKDGVFGMEKGDKNGKKEYYQYALFAEDNWNIIEPLIFTFGSRYDKHENFGDNLSPRAYLTYTLNNNWTIKGGVATGYKTPKTSDLQEGITGFGAQGTTPFIGNPDLKPEKSISKEIAVYYEHPEKHNFNLTLFQNNFKDKIDDGIITSSAGEEWAALGYDNLTQKQNIGKAEILGLEASGKYFILENLSIKANWTLMDSEVKSDDWKLDGKPLRSSPKQMYSTTLDWQTTPKLNTYIQYSGEIDRFNQRYQKDGVNHDLYFKDYSIWNLGASYKFDKAFTITSRVNNLFDKNYLEYSAVDSVGTTNYYNEYNNKTASRSFWLSARYTF